MSNSVPVPVPVPGAKGTTKDGYSEQGGDNFPSESSQSFSYPSKIGYSPNHDYLPFANSSQQSLPSVQVQQPSLQNPPNLSPSRQTSEQLKKLKPSNGSHQSSVQPQPKNLASFHSSNQSKQQEPSNLVSNSRGDSSTKDSKDIQSQPQHMPSHQVSHLKQNRTRVNDYQSHQSFQHQTQPNQSPCWVPWETHQLAKDHLPRNQLIQTQQPPIEDPSQSHKKLRQEQHLPQIEDSSQNHKKQPHQQYLPPIEDHPSEKHEKQFHQHDLPPFSQNKVPVHDDPSTTTQGNQPKLQKTVEANPLLQSKIDEYNKPVLAFPDPSYLPETYYNNLPMNISKSPPPKPDNRCPCSIL